MSAFRKNSPYLIIPAILSVVMHLSIVAAMSGMRGFDIGALFIGQEFTVGLVEDATSAPLPPVVRPKPRAVARPAVQKPAPVAVASPEDNDGTTEQAGAVSADDNREQRPDEEAAVAQQDQAPQDMLPQSGAIGNAAPPQETPKSSPPSLLKHARERLSFNISWLGVHVGKATLDAFRKKDEVMIISRVHSAPVISHFYRVDDFAVSTVKDGLPARFRIKQVEGRYRSDKETLFDTGNGKITFHNYIKGTKDDHTSQETLWDVLSGFYVLRSKRLEIGRPVHIDIFDSNKIYKTEVAVIRKEKVELPGRGQVDAVVVRPRLLSEGLFQFSGEILIWLTDDDERIPVKVETTAPIGTVVARIASLETE